MGLSDIDVPSDIVKDSGMVFSRYEGNSVSKTWGILVADMEEQGYRDMDD